MFKLNSPFKPSGDQPRAIDQLVKGVNSGAKHQVLLGVTGSGKTFTVANVIGKVQKPTLVVAHNKTLAAQLTQEFRSFFPKNAVEYFVSYYDYYQPEAYLPNTDTYIEKEATVNEEIDRLRNAATQAILSRRDVIVVASVSCIYGLGSPEYYRQNTLKISLGGVLGRRAAIERLVELQFTRSDLELKRGSFRVRGNVFEIMPADREVIYRIVAEDGAVDRVEMLDKVNRQRSRLLENIEIVPAKHYLVPKDIVGRATEEIENDLEEQLKYFRGRGKVLEAERLSRRTRYDLEMIREVGYCNGIENYSRYFEARPPGSAPFTLLDYFRLAGDFILMIDESHVTVSQVAGMYEGDKSRKDTLIKYGFRLPSARDNRPLKFSEFESKMPQTIYTSATPAKYELRKSAKNIIEQIVRPTGLVDPEVIVRATTEQITDLIGEIEASRRAGERSLVTTLTKKMAEDLSKFLRERKVSVKYLHSDVETLERVTILKELREGKFDVLVGVNLLREGLDLPEVSLVAILDADKEGFLRSETSLIQTIGRAARNINGKVVLYADHVTNSMERAIRETKRRRRIQLEFNTKHRITPKTIEKEIKSIVAEVKTSALDEVEEALSELDIRSSIKLKEKEMGEAARELRFEEAAILRDQVIRLKKAARFFSKAR